MRFEFTWSLTELGNDLEPFLVREAITSGDLTSRRAAIEALKEEASQTISSDLRERLSLA